MPEDPKVAALRAVAHPVRLQILSLLTGAEMSAAEVARELGLTHANASYHLRKLEAVGELTVTGEEHIRGGVAKRYRHDWRSSPAATYRPRGSRGPTDASGFVRVAADALVGRYAHRDTRRGAAPSSLTDAELWVAPEVYAEVRALLEQASRALHAAARPPRTEGTVRVNLTAAAFPMTDR